MTIIGAWCCVLRKILRILDKHLKKGLKKRIALRWETPTQSYTGRHSAPATLLPASERAPSVRHLKFKSFGSVSYNIANL